MCDAMCELLMECGRIRVLRRDRIGQEVVDVEGKPQQIAQSQSGSRQVFLDEIPLMEGQQTMLQVEYGVEKDQSMQPSLPIVPPQGYPPDQVRRQEREWRLRPLCVSIREDCVKVVFQ